MTDTDYYYRDKYNFILVVCNFECCLFFLFFPLSRLACFSRKLYFFSSCLNLVSSSFNLHSFYSIDKWWSSSNYCCYFTLHWSFQCYCYSGTLSARDHSNKKVVIHSRNFCIFWGFEAIIFFDVFHSLTQSECISGRVRVRLIIILTLGNSEWINI